jgi:hypothetical protein
VHEKPLQCSGISVSPGELIHLVRRSKSVLTKRIHLTRLLEFRRVEWRRNVAVQAHHSSFARFLYFGWRDQTIAQERQLCAVGA